MGLPKHKHKRHVESSRKSLLPDDNRLRLSRIRQQRVPLTISRVARGRSLNGESRARTPALNPTPSLPEPTQAGRNRERAPHAHPKSQKQGEEHFRGEGTRIYKQRRQQASRAAGWYRENKNDQKTIHSDAVACRLSGATTY